jgi:hypothetical protein
MGQQQPYAGGVPRPAERGTTPQSLPQVWRIPPWQPAALVLLATALGALDIYVRPSSIWMIMAALGAVAALGAAALWLRYLLVADEDGLWVRRAFAEELVEWRDVADVAMTSGHRNGMTVRITRVDGSYVDVPPALLLPTRPTTMPKVRSLIHGIATHLDQLADQHKK